MLTEIPKKTIGKLLYYIDIRRYNIYVDKIFNALADKNRRLILTLIKDQAMNVGDIVSKMPIGQPTVSTHLAILLKAKLVTIEVRGKMRFYQMNKEIWRELVKHLQNFVSSVNNNIPNEIIIRRK